MDLVLTKWIGLEATAILAEREEKILLKRFPAAMVRMAASFKHDLSVEAEVKIAGDFGTSHTCALAEGGVFTALWKLAEEAGAGLEVDLRKIPIRQETVEICEAFDLNPYNVLSGGSLLVAAKAGYKLTEELKKGGIEAAVIGWLTDGNDRILWNDGNKRFLDRPQKEELLKVYEEGRIRI